MVKMNRRHFLSQTSQALLAEPGGIAPSGYVDPSNRTLPVFGKTGTGINPYTGTWGTTQVMHLLNRTLFGVKKTDFDLFKNKSMSDAVDALLAIPPAPPAPPVNAYNDSMNDPNVPPGQTWVNAAADPNVEFLRIASWKAWWASLMIYQEPNIREKMTLFWHNHFATETTSVKDARYVYKHNALLRASCLGNFKDLVKAVTIDPAMLTYLNGNVNVKNAPDENYGRELQELFTVGKDLANRYTEDDVKAAARVLTGWKDDRANIGSTFNVAKHDTTDKQFSAFYGNTVITGRNTANAGSQELDDMLTMIFAQQEVARFICRKLYRFFVYYVIDQSVEDLVIAPLATVFRNSGYDIRTTLSTLLKSEHFYDAMNMGCYIKTPIDFTVGFFRQFNTAFPDSTDLATQYLMWDVPRAYSSGMQMDLGDPPNVAGWPAFYQEPQYHELWINSDTLPKRNLLADAMVYSSYTRNNFKLYADVIAFADQFSTPGDPNKLIDDCIALLYPPGITVSATNIAYLKNILLSGQASDHYWTDAWDTYKADPTNPMNRSIVNTRLQAMLRYLLDAAEYQLC